MACLRRLNAGNEGINIRIVSLDGQVVYQHHQSPQGVWKVKDDP
jgi:hypothetical protein